MTIGRICSREVHTVNPDETVRVAAQRMAQNCVGTLVVIDPDKRAAGLLTDRDVALRVVGAGRDPETTAVSDVMTESVHTAFEEMPIDDALKMMRTEVVRRLVVVARDGSLIGIMSIDDVLGLLAEEMRDVGALLEKEDPKRAVTAS